MFFTRFLGTIIARSSKAETEQEDMKNLLWIPLSVGKGAVFANFHASDQITLGSCSNSFWEEYSTNI